MVGNSSSGLFEVPTFKKPTVNIGNRQKGRTRSKSVIDCKIEKNEILSGILKAINMDCSDVVNPYGKGQSSKKIVSLLENINLEEVSLQKHFFG